MSNNIFVLSPHLQSYSLPLTVFCSIFHRISGILLSLSFVMTLNWYFFYTFYPESGLFLFLNNNLNLWFFNFLFVMSNISLTYHLLNGIRHILWDLRLCTSLFSLYVSSWFVILASILISSYIFFIYWI